MPILSCVIEYTGLRFIAAKLTSQKSLDVLVANIFYIVFCIVRVLSFHVRRVL